MLIRANAGVDEQTVIWSARLPYCGITVDLIYLCVVVQAQSLFLLMSRIHQIKESYIAVKYLEETARDGIADVLSSSPGREQVAFLTFDR